MLARLVLRDLTVTCAAPHSRCLCPFSSLVLSLAVHLAYISVESWWRTFEVEQSSSCHERLTSVLIQAHSFHKPGLSVFVLTLIVKYSLDDGDGMVCRHKCFISVVSGCRTKRKLKWGFLLGCSTCPESVYCVLAFFQPCFCKDGAGSCQLDHCGGDVCIHSAVVWETLHCYPS